MKNRFSALLLLALAVGGCSSKPKVEPAKPAVLPVGALQATDDFKKEAAAYQQEQQKLQKMIDNFNHSMAAKEIKAQQVKVKGMESVMLSEFPANSPTAPNGYIYNISLGAFIPNPPPGQAIPLSAAATKSPTAKTEKK
jgi:hypothetical protein